MIDIVDSTFWVLDCQCLGVIILTCEAATLGHDDKLVTGYLELLDSFANDLFRDAIAVYIGSIPLLTSNISIQQKLSEAARWRSYGVETSIICSFQQWKSLRLVVNKLVRRKGQTQLYFVLLDHPWLPSAISEAHRPQDRNRNLQSTLSQSHIFGMRSI